MFLDEQWLSLSNLMMGRDGKSMYIDFNENLKEYLNVKFSKVPPASQVHKSEDIEKSMGRIKKTCICFL